MDYVFEDRKFVKLMACFEKEFCYCPHISVAELPKIPKGNVNLKYYSKGIEIPEEFQTTENKEYKYSKRTMNSMFIPKKDNPNDINKISDKVWRQMKHELAKERIKLKIDTSILEIDNKTLEVKPRQKGVIKAKMGRYFFYATCSFCRESNLIPYELIEEFKQIGCKHLQGFYDPRENELITEIVYDKNGNSNFVATSYMKFVFKEGVAIV